MLPQTLRFALRRLRRDPVYAVLNGTGLSLGLAVFLVMVLYVYHESTYDAYHANADRIVRLSVTYGSFGESSQVPAQTAERIAATYPEVDTLARLYQEDVSVRAGDRRQLEDAFFYADPVLLDVFDLPLLRGNPATALAAPDAAVLTEATARRYFGSARDAMGRTLQRAEGPPLRVTGVLAPLPSNTHLQFDALLSYATLRREALTGSHATAFGQQGYAYLLLARADAAASLQQKLDALADEGTEAIQKVTGFAVNGMEFGTQALTDLHLQPIGGSEMKPPVDPGTLWAFGALGAFILLIALINYVNLATAQATQRALEVGVRKTMGADRRTLVRLFVGEALVLSLVAVLGAAVLIEALRPALNALLGTSLSALPFGSPALWAFYVGVACGVAALAGLYPAWVLAGYRPVQVMRGTAALPTGGRRFRQGLVVFQFAASIVLLALTFVVQAQVNYAVDKPLGYHTENVMTLPLAKHLGNAADAFRQEVERLPAVATASLASGTPHHRISQMIDAASGGQRPLHLVYGDTAYVETMGLELVAGRTYTARPADSSAVLVNETAARLFDVRARLGDPLPKDNGWAAPGTRVVGIVKDFHVGSLRDPIHPTVIRSAPQRHRALVVRLQPGQKAAALDAIERLWYTVAPNRPFLHRFADDVTQQMYAQERQLARRLGLFAGLAVLVAGLGLFGLAAFTAERRTKEISIRKVLGATTAQLVLRLNREFATLIGVACAVAFPLASWVALQWLQDFAYRMDLSPTLFMLAGGLTLLAALLPVTYHALRAATANPATTLRSE